MPQHRIPLKLYPYSPQGKRTVGRPKKRWREQLYLWRRNGPNGPTLDVDDDNDDDGVYSWSGTIGMYNGGPSRVVSVKMMSVFATPLL
jgi:hypothetical protein